jgi:hypothetical protein
MSTLFLLTLVRHRRRSRIHGQLGPLQPNMSSLRCIVHIIEYEYSIPVNVGEGQEEVTYTWTAGATAAKHVGKVGIPSLYEYSIPGDVGEGQEEEGIPLLYCTQCWDMEKGPCSVLLLGPPREQRHQEVTWFWLVETG